MPLLDFFKRKKTATPKLPTFKQNVSAFWSWYAENATRFYETIDAGKSIEMVDEISGATSKWLNDLAWVFGPGPNKQGHSFTVTPEGDEHRYFLADYWLKAAPELPGWTFYASRQPGEGNLRDQTFKIGDDTFKPEEFWITPERDIKNERIHITAWHPLFEKLPQKNQYSILFLWLDEVLGERSTADFIGGIELGNGKLKDSMPIIELDAYVREHCERNGWKGREPGTLHFSYQRQNPSDAFLRADIFTGTSCHMSLVNDYFDAEGNMDDPLQDSGAAYLFLAFDREFLPKGNEAHARGDIEDAITNALQSENSGICFGGAIGTRNAYIDLLIYDGDCSLRLIAEALRPINLPAGSALYPFAGRADVPLRVF